jgi:hypothetical protein
MTITIRRRAVAIWAVAALALTLLTACPDSETAGSTCKTEGAYRTRRTGHGIVSERCERDRGAPGLHWHENNATPPAPQR